MAREPRPVDEFETIARLFAPLAGGAPGAFGLKDDAAVIFPRPGHDLVVTTDAMVEDVHFLADDPLDLVARKLLRVNLSDLAAKAAEPAGYLLVTAWSDRCRWAEREMFAQGLAHDQRAFGLALLGGDTSSTPGPLTLSATLFGWVPEGGMLRRGGAHAGDRVLVSGTIGDGFLGLKASRRDKDAAPPAHRDWLAARYRLPEPRLRLREALRAHASAAADVSDGLVADAGHIGEASGLAVRLDLDHLPLSEPAAAWLVDQPDRPAALAALAAGGDDYEVVCTAPPHAVEALIEAAFAAGVPLVEVGEMAEGQGTQVVCEGAVLALERAGWRHL